LAIVGLAVFVAVDVVLVGAMALKAGSDSVGRGDENMPTSSSRTSAKTTAPTTPKPSAEVTEIKAPAVKPAKTRLLSIARDETVMKATRGSCEDKGPAAIRISSDLGKKFVARHSPVVQVLALDAESADKLTVTGADLNCTVGTYVSTDEGRTWTQSFDVEEWHFDPSGVKKVTSPSHTSKPGCDVVSISATDDSLARVACTNGKILGTGTGGKSWDKVGHLDDLRAAVFPAPGNGMALASFQGCAAQGFTTRDGGRTWSEAGCIAGSKAQAIAYNGTTLIAVVNDEIYVSTNKGSTWSQS